MFLLSTLLFLPLFSSIFVFFVNAKNAAEDRHKSFAIGMIASVTAFILSLILLFKFDFDSSAFQFLERFPDSSYPISYAIGVDGISMVLVVLTTAIVPLCFLFDYVRGINRSREYTVIFLLLETLMIGVFVSLDWLLFYVFFELSLVPMFLIIGIWGGKNKLKAAFKFFIYTLAGSILMLIVMAYVLVNFETTFIPDLLKQGFNKSVEKWIWWGLFLSFAIKMPLFPFHTWLAEAHVEAPTSGSVVLAAVLLKIGGYGLLRFCVGLLPEASFYFRDIVFALSICSVVYGSLVALVQTDIKKMIAYSSVAHMGFVSLGIFTFTASGVGGAIFQMISHGIISAGLFFSIGVIYSQKHNRDISFYGGIAKIMPFYATMLVALGMGSVALPGTAGFVGELLVIFGLVESGNLVVAGLAATSVILSAGYMLYLVRKILFGPIRNELMDLNDCVIQEKIVLGILVFAMVLFGIFPQLISGIYAADLSQFVLVK